MPPPTGSPAPDAPPVPDAAPPADDRDVVDRPVEQPALTEAAEPEGEEEDERALLEGIRSRLDGLTSLFQRRLGEDRSKEEAFQRLYEDLEVFRGQAAFQMSRPVFIELILLLDRLDGALASGEQTADPRAFLDSIRTEVEEILARRAISPVAIPDGVFDPKFQRAVEVVAAEDEREHNSIARVIRQGYEQDGQVVRPADVVVRRYTAVEATPDG